MKRKNWYCYVCGNKLQKSYYLCSMNNSTDRVFLICKNGKCVHQINDEDVIITEIVESATYE